MELINKFCNSFLFWAAWIIIPVMMEIVPSVGSVLVLLKKHLFKKKILKPAIDPEISLIIPIYNSMDTLEQCIQSIEDSDYPDSKIRIFLVNNQGQDNSFQVFCECQRKFPGLHMQWLNAKQGKSKALNLALFNSEGKYIIHIDSDGLLERSALRNMVYRFENDQSIECMTGVILTEPKQVQAYPLVFPRILRKMEFMEYAQAFLAGRNYSAEINAVYTLSGAFSAFRKSVVLKSQLYNTDTICEDTQITFQMKYLLKTKVGICEDAICLMCLNYSFAQVGYSTLFLYLLYVLIGFFYYISTVGFLKNFKEIRKYYAKQWYVLPLLPLFNLAVFFIRFAGVVNSINTNSAWKTKNFTQEKDSLSKTITDDFAVVMRFIRKIRAIVNKPEEHV